MMTKTVPACRFFNARTSWLKKRSAFVLKKRRVGHASTIIMRYHQQIIQTISFQHRMVQFVKLENIFVRNNYFVYICHISYSTSYHNKAICRRMHILQPLFGGAFFLRVYYHSSLRHAFSYFMFSSCELFCLEDRLRQRSHLICGEQFFHNLQKVTD